jgi:hypothetical protein
MPLTPVGEGYAPWTSVSSRPSSCGSALAAVGAVYTIQDSVKRVAAAYAPKWIQTLGRNGRSSSSPG